MFDNLSQLPSPHLTPSNLKVEENKPSHIVNCLSSLCSLVFSREILLGPSAEVLALSKDIHESKDENSSDRTPVGILVDSLKLLWQQSPASLLAKTGFTVVSAAFPLCSSYLNGQIIGSITEKSTEAFLYGLVGVTAFTFVADLELILK